jgi:hypothetical protein
LETDELGKTNQLIESLSFDFEKTDSGFKIFCNREDNVIINKILVENQIDVYNLESVSKTLEERFLGITGSLEVSI